jgi:hypothetical protein
MVFERTIQRTKVIPVVFVVILSTENARKIRERSSLSTKSTQEPRNWTMTKVASRNREKAVRQLAKAHARVANMRKNALHQTTADLFVITPVTYFSPEWWTTQVLVGVPIMRSGFT